MKTLPQYIVEDPVNHVPSAFERERIQQDIEKNGHRAYYSDHICPTCESSWGCSGTCKLSHESECKECTTNELLLDVTRLCDLTASFLLVSNPNAQENSVTHPYRMWMRGLADRAKELAVRS